MSGELGQDYNRQIKEIRDLLNQCLREVDRTFYNNQNYGVDPEVRQITVRIGRVTISHSLGDGHPRISRRGSIKAGPGSRLL